MSRISVFIFLAITAGLNLLGQSTTDVAGEWKALRRAGAKHFDAKNLTQAEELFTRALDVARATADPPMIVRTLEELGVLYYKSSRYTEARRCFEQVVDMAKETNTLEAPAVALAYNYIGLTERDLGKYAAAIDWHRRALQLLSNVTAYEDLASEARSAGRKMHAETEFALAVALHGYGLHKEAEEHYRKALDASKGRRGLDDLDLARVLTSLARLSMEQSNFDATRQFVHRAEKILQSAVRPDSPEWIDFHDVVASLLFCQGKHTEAERRWQDTLALGEKHFGPLHPNVLVTLARLGEFHLLLGEDEKAIEFLTKSMKGREQAYGKDHPDLAIVATQLALVQTRKREYVKAMTNYGRAVRLLEKNPGANQLILALTLQQKGDFHSAQRAWADATAAYERSLRLLESGLGQNHPQLASLLKSYANALRRDDRKKEAKLYDERARAIVADLRESGALRRHTVDIRTLRASNR